MLHSAWDVCRHARSQRPDVLLYLNAMLSMMAFDRKRVLFSILEYAMLAREDNLVQSACSGGVFCGEANRREHMVHFARIFTKLKVRYRP